MVLIFIILFQIITCTKRKYKSLDNNLTLFTYEHNIAPLIKRSKKENTIKNKYIEYSDDFYNECNNHRLKLKKNELNQLNFSIDICLKDNSNIYCALLSQVESGYMLLISLKTERKLVEEKMSYYPIKFADENKQKFNKIQETLTKKFKGLKVIEKKYAKQIFSELNFYIRNSTLHFYVFILNFIIETIEFMIIKLSIYDFEINYVFLELFELKRNNLIVIVNKIVLPNILLMFRQCIFLELPENNSEFNNLKQDLELVANNVKYFYKKFDFFMEYYDKMIWEFYESINITIDENV